MEGDVAFVAADPTLSRILCCECGTPIEPNPTSMCVACLRTHVDITDGIPKQAVLYFCKSCERYLQPPDSWVKCALETRELLALCLKKLKGLSQVRLVDAAFVWTEPHSRRIKVKLTIQKEVMNGTILQQVFIVEFVVNTQMCGDCHRAEAKDFWKAQVQLRMKGQNKKTFYYLEQLILKHKMHEQTVNIKPVHEGLDFMFANEAQARKFVSFVESVVPCRTQTSKKLISHDVRNNTYNYKFTLSVELVPVCKDTVVCLPRRLAHQMGGIGQLCVVFRVANVVCLIDPSTGQVAEVSGAQYWRQPFGAVGGPRQLTEFVVMDCEVQRGGERRTFAGQGALSTRHQVADVWVVRSSQLGQEDAAIHTRSHLGHLLKPGDLVLGLDLKNSNVNNDHLEAMSEEKLPDVLLVKKVFADPAARHRRRRWKLKHLRDDAETGSQDRDYAEFLEDLEEDPSVRGNVNIYRDATKVAVDLDDEGGYEGPQVTLQEMLEDLQLGEDATGGEGADMME
ncbi:60S ribosomal export protein NMD3-like isoform X2 [Amphibalanus amphitrite]|nr:60S ribosomal export protein NMD3-like isoform X2 [Amphibalanus amphitrite]